MVVIKAVSSGVVRRLAVSSGAVWGWVVRVVRRNG